MKISDFTYHVAWTFFYVFALIVAWNSIAGESWRFLGENHRKILAMIGLGIYVLLVFERKKRTGKTGW